MAFRMRWLENLRGVAAIALSLGRLGASSARVRRVKKGESNGLGWLQSREQEWARKRLDEEARLRLELQNIRAALWNRTTQFK